MTLLLRKYFFMIVFKITKRILQNCLLGTNYSIIHSSKLCINLPVMKWLSRTQYSSFISRVCHPGSHSPLHQHYLGLTISRLHRLLCVVVIILRVRIKRTLAMGSAAVCLPAVRICYACSWEPPVISHRQDRQRASTGVSECAF